MTRIFGDKVEIPTTEKAEDILRGIKSITENQKPILEKIETHLSIITDEELKESDTK